MILELHNMRIEPSNVKKKKSKKTTNCEKRTVTCDVGIAKMWRWNCQVWEKSKETIKFEKRTVTYDVETA